MTIQLEHFISAELNDWQTAVKDKDLTTAPETPSNGDRYIIAGTGGGWSSGSTNDIVWYVNSEWLFITPTEGMQVYVEDENLYYFYNGSAWSTISGGSSLWEVDGTETQLKTADAIDMQTNKIINVVDPTSDQEVATKKYVDDINVETSKNSDNIILNAFRIAINGALSVFNMIDGIVDEYEDETGIDTGTSTNENYDATDDFYSPSGTSRTWTANSNAQLDTAQKQFGTASLLCSSSGDNITTTGVTAFNVGTGNWTMDCYYRPNSYSSGSDTHTFMWLENASHTRILAIYKSSGTLTVETEYGTTSSKTFSSTTSVSTWYHIAVVRSGSDLKVFVDGTQVGSTESATNFDISTATKLYVGSFFNGGNYLDGWFDEFRFSTTARWTSNFTKPGSAHTTDANTVSLLHFDGTDASTTITDSVTSSYNNMTLVSDTFTAESAPDNCRIVMLEEDVDAITLNTDLKSYASNDDGSNWHQGTLSDDGDFDNDKRILVADFDVSAQTDTDMIYKIETLNNKNCRIHAIGFNWD